MSMKSELHEEIEKMYVKNKNDRLHSRNNNDGFTREYYLHKIGRTSPTVSSCFANASPSYVLIDHTDCTPFGVLLGGALLKHMDTICSIVAAKHCKHKVVTVSVDSVDFRHPVHTGDVCYFCPWVSFTSAKSIEIKVNVFLESFSLSSSPLVCSAYFTFVAFDDNSKAILNVPHLVLESKEEEVLFEERLKLYNIRKSKNI